VLYTVGLCLSLDKTLITHIDEGLDFLGWRIQRHASDAPTGVTSIQAPPRTPCGPPRWPRCTCVDRSARTIRPDAVLRRRPRRRRLHPAAEGFVGRDDQAGALISDDTNWQNGLAASGPNRM
jgi:hypothetical protein